MHRPTKQWLTVNTDAPKMVEHFEYVDTAGNQSINAHKTANLVGQLVRHYDPSGLVETLRLDFSGNVLEVQRRLNNQPHDSLIDWPTINPDSLLVTETFVQITEYDALKRMTKHYNWHRDITFAPDGTQQSTPGKTNRVAVYLPEYNQRGALASEWLHVRASKATDANGQVSFTADAQRSQQAIQEIRYNAKGQKELLELGNGTITRYDYDEKTFRLRQLRTTRPAYDPPFPQLRSTLSNAQVLQQLLYTYDPVGNITEIEDQAYKPVYFANGVAEPKSQYEYDALYRLISATGRETAQGGEAVKDGRDAVVANGFPITDQTLRRYTQSYEYDSVGNFVTMRHGVPSNTASGWTRAYTCATDSNRLLSTQQGSNTTNYGYDTHGNMLNLANVSPGQHLQWDHRDMIRSINLGGGGTAYYQYDASKQRTRKRIENPNGLGGYWERIYLGGYELYRRYTAANPAIPVEAIESLHLLEGEQRILLVDDVIITAKGSPHPRPDGLIVEAQTLFRYQYSNHLGSACLELDHVAEIISYEEYHPYGTSAYRAMKSGIEAPPKRYRYTGIERDEESGLGYHKARYYSPWLGKWVSADPAGLVDGTNIYAFVGNNPLMNTDLMGTKCDSTLQSCIDLKVPTQREEAKQLSIPDEHPVIESGGSSAATGNHGTMLTNPIGYEPEGSNPGEWISWEQAGGRTGEPENAVLRLARRIADYVSSVGVQTNEPEKAALRPFDPEIFVWASYEKKLETDAHLKKGFTLKGDIAAEGIFIAGGNSTGPFIAKIGAVGVSIGAEKGKRDAYVALYGGQETITQYEAFSGMSTTQKEPIILVEGGYGPAVAGSYQAGYHGEDTGSYLGVRGGPWAAGIGFNLDFLQLFLGTFGPPQTDNPWFQGPGGIPIGGRP